MYLLLCRALTQSKTLVTHNHVLYGILALRSFSSKYKEQANLSLWLFVESETVNDYEIETWIVFIFLHFHFNLNVVILTNFLMNL